MAAFRSASFCLICFLICSSGAQEKITAELGQNKVTLPCKVPNINFRAVEWIRPDQEPEYVLLYRDERLDPDYQHPSYQNRVDLQDKEMKDGDISMILKNVTKNDSGRYECYVAQGGTNRKKRSGPELINNIILEVRGDQDENTGDGGNKTGIIVGSVVGVILVAAAFVGFLMYKRHMKKNPNLPVPPNEPTAIQML